MNDWIDEKDYVPSTGLSDSAKYVGKGILRTAARGGEELVGGLGSAVGLVGDVLNTVKKGSVFGDTAGESFGIGDYLKKIPIPTRETIRDYVTEPLANALGTSFQPETTGQR